MKKPNAYFWLMIADIFLVIAWPYLLFCGFTNPATWYSFLIGVIWYDDLRDVFRHYRMWQLED